MGPYSIRILIVIAVLVGYNGVAERRHNSCVTWEDDLLTLNITCRVPNLSQPVTISNEDGSIQINCSTINQKLTCYPPEKNTSLDRNNRAVSILLIEQKSHKSLNGNWQCEQGGTKLHTNVSFSEGIISDSWVNLRGKIIVDNDGKRDIVVECSSCRTPDDNYVEFLVNNNSYGSMNYDKNIGVCYHNFIKCFSGQCNCSSTGNMFQLRLSVSDDIKEIACEMHFYDKYRRGKFGITSNLQITGNDVLYDSSITDAIVKNKYKPTAETINRTVTEDNILRNNKTSTNLSSGQGTEDNILRNNKTSTNVSSGQEISTSLTVVMVVVTLVTVILIICFLWYRRKLRSEENKEQQKNDEMDLNEDIEERKPMLTDIEERKPKLIDIEDCKPMLIATGDDVIQLCGICKRGLVGRPANSFCLNCDEMICTECGRNHANLEQMKKHDILPLSIIPVNFNTSFVCHRHNKKEYTFYCTNHKEVLCEECFKKYHNACCWWDIDTVQVNTVFLKLQHLLQKLKSELESKSADLHYYQSLSSETVKNLKSEISRLGDSQIRDQQILLPIKQNALSDQLKLKQENQEKTFALRSQKISDLYKKVTREIKILMFIKDNVGWKQLFIYVHEVQKNIDELASLIRSTDTNMIYLPLKLKWTLDKPCLGRIESNLSTSKEENTNLAVASQTPSMAKPVYSYHEKTFECHFSNLAWVFDGSLVLVSNEATEIVVYNSMLETRYSVDLEYPPHDIEVIPKTKRVIATCKSVDKIQERNLDNNKLIKMDIECCAGAVLAITPAFILLGLRSKRIISVLQHDGQCVFNIETNNDVDRLCYNDDRISYLSSNSKFVISIYLTGKEAFSQVSKLRPVDILATDRGHFIILEKSERALRKCSMDGKELPIVFEDEKIWKDVTAFCSNADASGIYILSYNGERTTLSVLSGVIKESSSEKFKGTINADDDKCKDSSRDSAKQELM